jgi:hypothetical protein
MTPQQAKQSPEARPENNCDIASRPAWYVYHGGTLLGAGRWSGPHGTAEEAEASRAECVRFAGGSPTVEQIHRNDRDWLPEDVPTTRAAVLQLCQVLHPSGAYTDAACEAADFEPMEHAEALEALATLIADALRNRLVADDPAGARLARHTFQLGRAIGNELLAIRKRGQDALGVRRARAGQ